MGKIRQWLIAHPAAAALGRHAVTVVVSVSVALLAVTELVGPPLLAACQALVLKQSASSLYSPVQWPDPASYSGSSPRLAAVPRPS